MADKEVPTDLAELGTAIVDADYIIVNKKKAIVTRLVTYISSKFSAGTGLTKTAESYAITAGGVGTTQLAADGVTDTKLRDGAACSVIGRSANSSGDPADITASTNDRVLARTGNALSWVQLTIGMFVDGVITLAKLANGTALSLVGRSANSTGVYADISASAGSGAVLRESGSVIGFGTIVAAGIASAAVTMAKLAAFPSASLTRATAQSIGTGSLTIVQFSAQAYTATGGSDAPTVDIATNYRVTVNKAGLYRISGQCGFLPATGVAANSTLGVSVCVNGTEEANTQSGAVLGTVAIMHTSKIVSLAANDYVDLRVFQTTGNSQNTIASATSTRPQLHVEYVGPAA